MYSCDLCDRTFKSKLSLGPHKNSSHYGYKQIQIYCSSVVSKRTIQIQQLNKHHEAWIKNGKECPECQIIHRNPKFCSQKCSTIYCNRNSTEETIRKRKDTLKDTLSLKYKSSRESEKYSRYRSRCKFQLRDVDIKNIKGYHLYEEFGLYHPIKNRGGVQKDHQFSVYDGYDQNIDSDIIRHPANCEFLLMRDNILKSNSSSISLDELLLTIQNWYRGGDLNP